MVNETLISRERVSDSLSASLFFDGEYHYILKGKKAFFPLFPLEDKWKLWLRKKGRKEGIA